MVHNCYLNSQSLFFSTCVTAEKPRPPAAQTSEGQPIRRKIENWKELEKKLKKLVSDSGWTAKTNNIIFNGESCKATHGAAQQA